MATTSQPSALTNSSGTLLGVALATTYTTLIASLSSTSSALLIMTGGGDSIRTSRLVDFASGAPGSEVMFLPSLLSCSGNDSLQQVLLWPKGFPAGTRISARCQGNNSSAIRAHVIAIQGDYDSTQIETLIVYGANLGDSGGMEIPVPTAINTKGDWSADITGGGLSEDIDGFYVAIGDQGVAAQPASHVLLDIGTGASPTVVYPDLQMGTDSAERFEPQVLPYVPMALAAGTQIKARFQSSCTVLNQMMPFDIIIYAVSFEEEPTVADGPWQIAGAGTADPIGPGGANVLMSTDADYATAIPVGTPYGCPNEEIVPITGASAAQIDTGDLRLSVRVQATRMTGETQDEFQIGVEFYDVGDVLISSSASAVFGTSRGLLTATWRDFFEVFAIPTGSRGFKIPPFAIKRNSTNDHARLEFYLPRATVVATQDSPFADTHATELDAYLRGYAGLVDNEIDVGRIEQFKIDNQGKAFFYDDNPTMSRLNWMRIFLGPDLMAFPTYNRAGQFSVGQIRDTASTHTILPKHIAKPLYTVNAPDQHNAETIEYARSYTKQNADTLAGALSDPTSIYYNPDLAAIVGLDYRTERRASDELDPPIDTSEAKGAIEGRSQTYFADLDGALAELIRRLKIIAPQKDVWVLPLVDYQLQIIPCDVATVTYTDPREVPRWRFTEPREGIVLAVQEESAEERTTITWWG